MDVVLHEQFQAPLATTVDELLRDQHWLPDDLADRLSGEDKFECNGPCGRAVVWNAAAWHRDRETRFYYVTAVDGPRKYVVAGPYPTHAEAESRVSAVCAYARDHDGRAHWMAWGTASSYQPHDTVLGAF